MKKIAVLLMSALLSLSLASCTDRVSHTLELNMVSLDDIGAIVLEPFYLEGKIVFSGVSESDIKSDSEFSYDSDDVQLYSVDMDNSKINKQEQIIYDKVFSDEENYYWINRENDSQLNLMKTDKESKKEEKLTSGENFTFPFEKYKDFIFWREVKEDSVNLVRFNVKTMEKDTVLTLPKEDEFLYPEFTICNGYAAGSYTDYRRKGHFIAVKNIENKKASEYCLQLDEPCINAISDGKNIYYTQKEKVAVHNIETGEEKTIHLNFDSFIDILKDRYLVFTKSDNDYTGGYYYDLVTEKISEIDTGDEAISSVKANADKTELIFISSGKKEQPKLSIGTVKFKS